jgi:hypothetical protein
MSSQTRVRQLTTPLGHDRRRGVRLFFRRRPDTSAVVAPAVIHDRLSARSFQPVRRPAGTARARPEKGHHPSLFRSPVENAAWLVRLAQFHRSTSGKEAQPRCVAGAWVGGDSNAVQSASPCAASRVDTQSASTEREHEVYRTAGQSPRPPTILGPRRHARETRQKSA